jgi:hypothetical protein
VTYETAAEDSRKAIRKFASVLLLAQVPDQRSNDESHYRERNEDEDSEDCPFHSGGSR